MVGLRGANIVLLIYLSTCVLVHLSIGDKKDPAERRGLEGSFGLRAVLYQRGWV